MEFPLRTFVDFCINRTHLNSTQLNWIQVNSSGSNKKEEFSMRLIFVQKDIFKGMMMKAPIKPMQEQ